MSDMQTLTAEVENLKTQVEYLTKKVKYLSFWNDLSVQRRFREADERHRQSVIEEHNAYVDSLPHEG